MIFLLILLPYLIPSPSFAGSLHVRHSPHCTHSLPHSFLLTTNASHTNTTSPSAIVNMCRTETSLYKCGHSAAVETQCQPYIESGGRRCKRPSSNTGYENRVETDCPACAQREKKKTKFVPKPLDELAIVVPDQIDFRKLPDDPNCGNPKASEESKPRCDAM